VRRRLGAWYREQLRERVGPLTPPVPDLPKALQAVAAAGAELAPRLEGQARQIIAALATAESGDETEPANGGA
jgi:hypothetical protein